MLHAELSLADTSISRSRGGYKNNIKKIRKLKKLYK